MLLPNPTGEPSRGIAEIDDAFDQENAEPSDDQPWEAVNVPPVRITESDLRDRSFPSPVQQRLHELEARAEAAEAHEAVTAR